MTPTERIALVIVDISTEEAIEHLEAALDRVLLCDDTTVGHIKSAHTCLTNARRALRLAPPANENLSLDDVDRAVAAVAAEFEARQ